MKTLIVVDMQNDFISGPLGTPEAKAIVPNVKNKIEKSIENKQRVIFTRDTHNSHYWKTHEGKLLPVMHCIEGTPGWCVCNEVEKIECRHINKRTFGYQHWAYEDDFEEDIEIIGVCTDICVVSNALILRALYPELNITVDASCCAGTTPENHKAALQVMKCCQINVIGE